MQLAPLRPFDRIVAGYATLAFAMGAAESVAVREWLFASIGTVMATLGVALLVHDHLRWRGERRRGVRTAR